MKIGGKDVASIDINSKALNLYEDFQKLANKTITTVTAAMLGSPTAIKTYFFANCADLEYVEIPESVILLETSAFQSCTALENITFPSQTSSFANANIFRYCTALKRIEFLAPNVTSFGLGVFQNCAALADFWIHTATPPTINTTASGTFIGTWSQGVHHLHVPAGSVSAYQGSSWNSYFNDIHGFLQDGKNARYVLYYDLTDEEALSDTSLLTFNLLDSDDDTGGTVDTVTVSAQDHKIVLRSEGSIAIPSGYIFLSYSDPAPTVIDLTSLLSDATSYLKITEVTDAGKEHLYTLS